MEKIKSPVEFRLGIRPGSSRGRPGPVSCCRISTHYGKWRKGVQLTHSNTVDLTNGKCAPPEKRVRRAFARRIGILRLGSGEEKDPFKKLNSFR
jgi:hypothetical protein